MGVTVVRRMGESVASGRDFWVGFCAGNEARVFSVGSDYSFLEEWFLCACVCETMLSSEGVLMLQATIQLVVEERRGAREMEGEGIAGVKVKEVKSGEGSTSVQ